MAKLNVLVPDVQPKATEYIPEMIDLIKELIEKDFAYEKDGHVLFHVPNYENYGKLSKRNPEELVAGARVEISKLKNIKYLKKRYSFDEDSLVLSVEEKAFPVIVGDYTLIGWAIENMIKNSIDSIEIDRLKRLFGIEHNIVQGANGILNGKVLRFKNEPVRHKTLDLIGDLALLGVPIKGHVTAARAGHASNVEFVKKLKKQYSKELKQLWEDEDG